MAWTMKPTIAPTSPATMTLVSASSMNNEVTSPAASATGMTAVRIAVWDGSLRLTGMFLLASLIRRPNGYGLNRPEFGDLHPATCMT